jgi:hypothetical protein
MIPQAGDYTVIVSAYEPRQEGAYTLSIESARDFELTPIPPEGAGMYNKTLRGLWCISQWIENDKVVQLSVHPQE